MYEMKIQVRYSEVDQSGVVRLHQILEYFQDCGMFQSEELGLGVEEDQKNHRAWYLIAWNVKIIRKGVVDMMETVLIETLWNVKTKAEQKLIEESGINDKIKAELSEAKIKGVDKIKPDKMTLRNSLSIMDI